MKVYPEKLAAHLKKNAPPVHIVSGDDPLLVQESVDLIRSALRDKGVREREVFHVEGNFDWTTLLYSVNSMSLFAEQKLIEVRIPNGKPGDKGSKALVEFAGQLGSDNFLLLVLPRIDQSGQRTKWFKTLEAMGVFIQVWPVEAKDLPRWLEGRFRQAGLKASREAIRMLAERTEGNLLAAVQEIERLKLTSGGQVDVEDVIEGVADSARYDVFKLIDAALTGDCSRAVRMTDGLQAEGVEVLFIVNMLSRELRSLEAMKLDIRGGMNPREVLKKARVWDKRQPVVTRCLERHDARDFRALEESLGYVDRMVKGIVQGDPWRELQTVIMTLAGVPILPGVSSQQ